MADGEKVAGLDALGAAVNLHEKLVFGTLYHRAGDIDSIDDLAGEGAGDPAEGVFVPNTSAEGHELLAGGQRDNVEEYDEALVLLAVRLQAIELRFVLQAGNLHLAAVP